MIVWTLEIAFMLLAYIPINAFSRFREYQADAGSARLTGAEKMISALKKIDKICSSSSAKNRHDGYEVAKINSRRRVMLFSTHPSTEDRIRALKNL